MIVTIYRGIEEHQVRIRSNAEIAEAREAADRKAIRKMRERGKQRAEQEARAKAGIRKALGRKPGERR